MIVSEEELEGAYVITHVVKETLSILGHFSVTSLRIVS